MYKTELTLSSLASGKEKKESEVAQLYSALCDPHGL